ncbi:MAG: hypothetical protein SNJ29_12500 [Rikenellaceae bacterium]
MERDVLRSVLRADGKLTIEVTGEDIWMTRYEIVELLALHSQSVVANLREIYRREELLEHNTVREEKGVRYYNLDVLLALVFRCKGGYCRAFKEWMMDRIKRPIIEHRQPLIIALRDGNILS